MDNEFEKLFYPRRKHPRLKEYDYATDNYYFVTICTHEKACIFGGPEHLNSLGVIAYEAFHQIPIHTKNAWVDKWVVMPNHVHAILILQDCDTALPTIVGQYKSFVSKEIHKIRPNIKVWQTSFYENVIRNQKRYEEIWNYIEGNPLKWAEDRFYVN